MSTSNSRPHPTSLSEPFWAAAREGHLALQRCSECGSYRWTPQVLCINCHSEAYEWTPVSGRGRVYSYSIVHRAPTSEFESPYVVAVVELDEGPLMLTNIVGCSLDAVRVGMPVEVALRPLDDQITLYPFRPA